MTELLEHVELNPIARMAITDFLEEVPDGSRISRFAYDKWRSSKKDPFLPTYQMLETNHPEVPTLFNHLSDELVSKRRGDSLVELANSVKLFTEETGSKRIRAYNEWRVSRRETHGEEHPSPNLGARNMKWEDVLIAAGANGCDPRASDLCKIQLCLARFMEESLSYTSYSYRQWHKQKKQETHPALDVFGLTSVMNHMGPTWEDVMAIMGFDLDTLTEIRRSTKRIRFTLTDGCLTRSETAGFLYQLVD